MSRRITSFLTLLAVLLLPLSSQAQAQKRQSASLSTKVTEMPGLKKAQSVKPVKWDWVAHAPKQFVSKSGLVKQDSENTRATLTTWQREQLLRNRVFTDYATVGRRAAATDGHGIITEPEDGEHKFYTREGNAYYNDGGFPGSTTQLGRVEIVECEDGTVYIKDIISTFLQGSWVKGTKSGNTITVPAGQPVAYNSMDDSVVGVYWGYTDYNTLPWFFREDGDITFTIDGNTISLDGDSNDFRYIGVYYNESGEFVYYANYNTVWTLDEGYVPPSAELVSLPANADVQTWYVNGMTITEYDGWYDQFKYSDEAAVAFVGNDVYLNIFTAFNAWIKGTINGTTVTFECPQYLGVYGSDRRYFAFGSDGYTVSDQLQNFQMTYDEETQTLTSVGVLLANEGDSYISFLEAYTDFTVSKDKPVVEEPTASTGANVDVLPYSNTLTTADEFAVFGVLDTNEDEKTWTYHTYYNDTRYATAWYYDGDDWLISPAIKLEAGKHYHFAIDAKTSYGLARFDVKMANGEAKASVLEAGEEMIPSTNVTVTAFKTYEKADFTVSETGYYHFGIHATSEKYGYDNLIVANFLVEAAPDESAPAAVEGLSVTPLSDKLGAMIAFTAPTKSLGGATLAAGDIAKIEVLRDDAVIKTFESPAPGSGLSYTDDASDLTIGNHNYQVISYGAESVGGKSMVVEVFLSATLTVPTSFDFTKKDVYDTFLTIDANHDNFGVWDWDSYTGAYYYGSGYAADDYLVSTGILLEAGEKYMLTVTANCHSSNFPERFEVKLGKEATVEGLNLTAMGATIVTNEEFEDYESEFAVAESGVYHVAIHAISDADMWRLNVIKLAINNGLDGNAPAAPLLIVEPGEKGAEYATVTVTAPTKTADGAALSANLTKLEVLRDGEVIKTFENVAPGAVETFTDEDLMTANHTYQAIPYDANGAGQKSERVTVYVGEEYFPGNVQNIQIPAETATTLTFTWDKVVGQNGGYLNPEGLQYSVIELEYVQTDWFSFFNELQTLATTSETTATVDYPVDEGEQDYKYFGVKATTAFWNESDVEANIVTLITGAPYGLPFEEIYNGTYAWLGNDNAAIALSADGNGDNTALALSAQSEAGLVTLETGKLSTQSAANATVMFDAKKGTSAVDKIAVYGIAPDGTETDIETVTLTSEYQTYTLQIPASLKSERWTRIGFKADFEATGKHVLLDNIRVLDFYQHDLSIAVEAPAFVQAGSKATVKTIVRNEGANAANGYTVVIKAGEKELQNTTVNEVLQPFVTNVVTAEFEATAFDEPADVTITATVVYEGDENTENNTAETVISIKESTVPKVTNVTAEDSADGVVIGWTAPESDVASAARMTENFEIGAGGWTFIDADGDGFNWDYIYSESIEGTLAHSGCGVVYSNSYDNEFGALTPDNWLVSPQAALGGTFKFWALGQDSNDYAEHFQVYVSTTSATEVTTFEPVGEEFVATAGYAEYSVDLSAYAGKSGWIAVRHFNVTDMYRLLVDDITFHIGIEKYNIYVDGKLATSVAVGETTATVEGLETGNHTIAVSAVYATGQESKPVVANDVVDGIATVTVMAKPVDVYSVDGSLVRRQATSLNGLKGIYIVNGKKVVLK